MDTSKEYILMCQKAEEIQKKLDANNCETFVAPNVDGLDRYDICDSQHYNFNKRKKIVSWEYDDGYIPVDGKKYNLKDVVFLPRQDQLQTIYLDWLNDKFGLWSMLNDFQEFVFGYAIDGDGNDWGRSNIPKDEIFKRFTSMEQLWLSFVMKTKYSKVWNGSEWEVSK